MLTVRELVRDIDIRLLAGEQALDAAVRWVHITELEDPTPWLSGGELLLTTGLQLATPERQASFVRRLADHGLAGLGFGIGFGFDSVPEALVETARERGLPLFEVPYDVPFIAITEIAFSRLVNEQYAVLRRAIAAHERLERIVLSERGIDAVAGALSTLVGGAVMVFDARGGLLAQRPFRTEVDDETIAALERELRDRTRAGRRRRSRRGFAPTAGTLAGRALALPVGASGPRDGETADGGPLLQAWLVAAKDTGSLSEFDRLTLHQAVTIVALEMLRRRVAEDTERRLAGDVLSGIVTGELSGGDLARRLEPFGLGSRVAVMVLTPPRPGAGGMAAAESALAGALARRGRRRPRRRPRGARRRARAGPRRGGAVPAHAADRRPRHARARAAAAARRRPRRRRRRRAPRLPRGALRAGGARARAAQRQRRRRRRPARSERRSPPTATSAPSSCCCRCRTTTRCGSSATRSSPRSRRARARTAAS